MYVYLYKQKTNTMYKMNNKERQDLYKSTGKIAIIFTLVLITILFAVACFNSINETKQLVNLAQGTN